MEKTARMGHIAGSPRGRAIGLLAWMVMLLLLVAGCRRHTVSIPPPAISGPNAVPPVEESVVPVSIVVELAPVFQEIDAAVPQLPSSEAWEDLPGRSDLQYRYRLQRGKLDFALAGRQIGVTVPFTWGVGVRSKETPEMAMSCGLGPEGGEARAGQGMEAPRRATGSGSIELAVGEQWDLRVVSVHAEVKPVDACRLPLLSLDVAPVIMHLASEGLHVAIKEGVTLAVDHSTRLREGAEAAWQRLRQPVPVAQNVWLSVDPTGIVLQDYQGRGSQLAITAGLTARPVLTYGQPVALAPTPLPSLVQTTLPPRFRVNVLAKVPFDEASKALYREIATHPATGRRKRYRHWFASTRITDAKVYGNGHRVVIALTLAGSLQGTVYFVGTMNYDPAKNELYVSDVDYSIETKRGLGGALGLAESLFHKRLRSKLEQAARYSVNKQLQQARADLQKAINRPIDNQVRLQGTVTRLEPIGLYTADNAFYVAVRSEGQLQVAVTPQPPGQQARRPEAGRAVAGAWKE